ncbi:MAG TPA: ComEC/Rec2 family competence protein [Bacteroidales bacterium]|nr:DUF4131 domain-containing protein [Bacteroidales bacterium]HNR41426.1 ComEC/Rec2 family competence protein [Bacteroidales bacterium]HPM18933.1 ComEC/Rec2 family competence protein [Bacteroidales bacterium]HQG76822.1 ComEC/Rec2 family competence protein [Bacteroidales bacterium]
MLNKEIPFLRIGLPFCLGIISGRCFTPGPGLLGVFTIIVITGFIASLFFNSRIVNPLYGFAMSIALLVTGLVLYNHEKAGISDLEQVTNEFLCILSEFPEEKGKSTRMVLELKGMASSGSFRSVHGSILVHARKDPAVSQLLPGDILLIRCRPERIMNRGNPCEFDYKFYLENHGIRFQAFIDKNDVLSHIPPQRRKLIYKALIIREKIIDIYRSRGICCDRLALVAAITLGQKNLLDREQKQYFIKAGVMHIMAVSGLHAVILSLFVQHLLFFLRGRFTFLRRILTMLFLWSFAFVTGLTPSVLRATIMYTFLQTGKLLGRNANNLNSVLASAFFQLLWKPSVLFDAGFQLSYSAVIFIICFYGSIYRLFSIKNWLTDKIWQSVVVTIVAQAGTLSLTISLFNRFPTYFIITNLLIVPLSNILIITGCLVPLTYPLEFLSRPLAGFLEILTGITEGLTRQAASLPFSTIDPIGLGTFSAFALSVFIFLLFQSLSDHKNKPLFTPLIALLIFMISLTYGDITARKTNELIVYNTSCSYAVGIRTGKCMYIFSSCEVVPDEVSRHCAMKNLKIRKEILPGENSVIEAGRCRILVSGYLNNRILEKADPDYVIIYAGPDRSNRPINANNRLNTIIFTRSLTSPQLQKGVHDRVRIHHVKRSGAFVTRLDLARGKNQSPGQGRRNVIPLQ